MRQIHSILLVILLCVPMKANLSEIGVSVNLHDSQIKGKFDNENELFIFRGIPYAQPPIGELRWQSPAPLSSSPKAINAENFKPACMQDEYSTVWYKDVAELFGNPRSVFDHVEAVSEDCLYLNIWTNSLDQTSKKPVMVWVHGGADTGGWAY